MKLLTINNQQLTIKRRAFTLIELLVVITIIAILAAVVMLVINPLEMTRKGRDATRFSDIENVRKAIDILVAQEPSATIIPNNGAVIRTTLAPYTRVCNGTGWVNVNAGGTPAGLCEFLSTLPIDPTNDANFYYGFGADGSYYELNSRVESAKNFPRAINDGGSDNTCTGTVGPGGASCWYEVGTSLTVIP